jgi:hypothetical protein
MRLLAVVLLLSALGDASAQTLFDRGPPEHRIVHRSLVALRVNPLGLVYDGRISYRHRLYEHAGLALRDNFAGGGLALMVTPAFLKIGPIVEVAPASFLTLWASFQLDAYFGSFDQLQSFPNARVMYTDETLEAGDSYSSLGSELTLAADLQLKVGPVALRGRNKLLRADLDLRGADRVFYDQITDVLLPDEGWAYTTDVDAVWVGLQNRLVIGLRYSATVPFHDEAGHDKSVQRLGPLLAYSFFVRDGARLNAPGVFLLVQWWLDHPYRLDEPGQAVPLVGIGFQVSGDLLKM